MVVVLVLLVLLAMRVFAWAGWTRMGAEEPTAVTMSRMPQASATHADQVRTRMVPSLSFQGLAERSGPARGARGQREGKRG